MIFSGSLSLKCQDRYDYLVSARKSQEPDPVKAVEAAIWVCPGMYADSSGPILMEILWLFHFLCNRRYIPVWSSSVNQYRYLETDTSITGLI